MAKYFLGSVGTVEAFEKVGDKYKLAFVSKTLTDSGINTSISKEDIRGGSNASIQFSFYHDPNEFTDKTINSADFKANKKYCVRYCVADPKALIARVTTSILPKEYMLIITAPVFSGDSCASNGKRAGTITYEIPRFRLNGGSEMAFNMSSNQTMNLAGLAYSSETCDLMEANLYNIILSLDDGSLAVKELIVDEDTLKVGKQPKVYGLLSDGRVSLLDNTTDLTFNGELTKGAFTTAGSVTITYKLNPKITDTVTVAA